MQTRIRTHQLKFIWFDDAFGWWFSDFPELLVDGDWGHHEIIDGCLELLAEGCGGGGDWDGGGGGGFGVLLDGGFVGTAWNVVDADEAGWGEMEADEVVDGSV